MIMLTGGEKYNTKNIILKINDIYPKISEIISNEKYTHNNSMLTDLYNYTLEIFIALTNLTTNIINSSSELKGCFDLLQDVHYYKSVSAHNKDKLIEVVNRIPQLQEDAKKKFSTLDEQY